MPDIRMYSTHVCPYCMMAERLLHKKGVQVQKIYIDTNPHQLKEMIKITGRRTVPQIFIGEQHVGGFDDLTELDLDGKLDPLLSQ
ncbi:MAG: glutaredoxin 3 [Thiomargarita sp.]|nr:glutaredoxin 3 [Thiomargarita sp.]